MESLCKCLIFDTAIHDCQWRYPLLACFQESLVINPLCHVSCISIVDVSFRSLWFVAGI